MADQSKADLRCGLLHAFGIILANHTDRAEAGLAALRTMRQAGYSSWSDLFLTLREPRQPRGFRATGGYGYRPAKEAGPEYFVWMMARRLDDLPAADLAELAVLAGSPQTARVRARSAEIVIPWMERRRAEDADRDAAAMARAQAQAEMVRRDVR